MPYAEFRYPYELKEAVPSLEPLIAYRATLPVLSDDDLAAVYRRCHVASSPPFIGYRVYKRVQRLLKTFADTSRKSPDYVLMSNVDRQLLWVYMASTVHYDLPGFTPDARESIIGHAANHIPNEATGGMVCTAPLGKLKEDEVIVGFYR